MEAQSLHSGTSGLQLNYVRKFLALYLSAIWLLPDVKLPLGPFQGIPLYVALTPAVLVLLGRRAARYCVTLGFCLFSVELIKNFQPGYYETLKAILGLFAISLLLPSIFFALQGVLRGSPEFIATWLNMTLLAEFGGILLSLLLGSVGLVHSKYKHYFLPIHSYSGFFSEPSHVAICMSPFVFMLIFDYRLYRKYLGWTGIIGAVGIFILCSSATEFAVVGIALGAIMVRQVSSGRIGSIALTVAGAVIGAFLALRVPKIAARVVGVLGPGQSLLTLSHSKAADSVLVFYKGFEMARFALLHMPLGAAFLNMSSFNRDIRISKLSSIMYHLNARDGGSILFKGICEYGYLFVAFGVYAIAKMIIDISSYKRFATGDLNFLIIIALEVSLVMYFVRGGSYFEGVLAFSLALLLHPARRTQ